MLLEAGTSTPLLWYGLNPSFVTMSVPSVTLSALSVTLSACEGSSSPTPYNMAFISSSWYCPSAVFSPRAAKLNGAPRRRQSIRLRFPASPMQKARSEPSGQLSYRLSTVVTSSGEFAFTAILTTSAPKRLHCPIMACSSSAEGVYS